MTKILWSQEALRNFHFDYPLKTQLLLFSRVIVTSFGSFLHHTKSCSKSFLASQNITLGMENTGKIYFSKSLLITLNRPKLIKRSIVDNSIHWINLCPGLLIFRGKKAKFRGIFRGKFAEKSANFAGFCIFLGISRDFPEIPEFRGSATARNIRSPVYPVDKACGFPNTCLLNRDITGPSCSKGG